MYIQYIIGRKTVVLIPSNTSFLPVQCQRLRDHIQIWMLHFSFFFKPLLALLFRLFTKAISTIKTAGSSLQIAELISLYTYLYLLIYYII